GDEKRSTTLPGLPCPHRGPCLSSPAIGPRPSSLRPASIGAVSGLTVEIELAATYGTGAKFRESPVGPECPICLIARSGKDHTVVLFLSLPSAHGVFAVAGSRRRGRADRQPASTQHHAGSTPAGVTA